MEQEVKTKEKGGVTTRAEKKDAAKGIIRELLQQKSFKAGELIDEAAKLYTQRFKGEDTENVNDVKGRVGSVLDVMKKEEEVSFEGGMYALKSIPVVENKEEKAAEKPKKSTRKTTKKTEKATVEIKSDEAKEKKEEEPAPVAVEEKTEKPAAKKRTSRKKAETAEVKEEEKQEEPKTEEKPFVEEKKPAKKRATKKKAEVAEVKTEEKAAETTEKAEVKAEKEEAIASAVAAVAEEKPLVEEKKPTAEKKEEKLVESVPHAVMDMSFLLGDVKGAKKAEKPTEQQEPVKAEEAKAEKKVEKPVKQHDKPTVAKKEEKREEKAAEKAAPAAMPAVVKPAQNGKKQSAKRAEQPKKTTTRAMTADEKLKEAFLKKLHKLGGEYFEYYSVYLLEKYSRMNGRRLEGLKISAGDRDGGIDGEIEVTDRLGFRETIYIQAKNWDPDKGDEKLWVVGETLLQQFIGACVCRQAKEGKQHCRGIFITTSRFTPEAKRILEDTSDKFVGYDGEDLYETAKECGFGIVKKNGEYVLDETLLSGEKAFFNMT